MQMPVDTDYGGYRRFGYILNGLVHCGHDFNIPKNYYVHAICKQEIIFSDLVEGFGGLNPRKPGGVIIAQFEIDNQKYTCLYGHINRFKKVGDIVEEGDLIGHIADFYNEGLYLPHLHFGIHRGPGKPKGKWGYVTDIDGWIDPLAFIRQHTGV